MARETTARLLVAEYTHKLHQYNEYMKLIGRFEAEYKVVEKTLDVFYTVTNKFENERILKQLQDAQWHVEAKAYVCWKHLEALRLEMEHLPLSIPAWIENIKKHDSGLPIGPQTA